MLWSWDLTVRSTNCFAADPSTNTPDAYDSVQLSPACDDRRLAFSTPPETLVCLHIAIHQHDAWMRRSLSRGLPERGTAHHKVAFVFAATLGICVARAGAQQCPVSTGVSAAQINIPAEPLSQALQSLAAQTGLDILFEPSTVGGLRSVEVRGKMTPGDALCRLLGDAGLTYSVNEDRTVIITRQNRGASEVENTPQVIVTGTRRKDQLMADSPVPIGVISGESLAAMGSTDTDKALSVLVPSFNFPQPSLTDATDIIRPATLRGLGPDQMLVLVNGKRRHVSALLNINSSVGRGAAAVDMSTLPIASIDRVEILRDGAAAQYGSDAIAGVINVLLKKQREGADVSVTYGQNYTTIGGVPRAGSVELQPNGEPVLSPDGVYVLSHDGDRQAHDGESVTVSGNLGVALGPQGFLDISAQARNKEPTNRAGYDPRRQYPLTATGLADSRELTFDRLSHHFGEPRLKDADAVLNTGVPIAGGAADWYAFGTYGARYGTTDGLYRMARDPGTVRSIFPNGFLAQLKVDLDDKALATGIRGTWRQWNYDVSVNCGRNVIDFTTDRSDNASLGDASPTRFDAGGLRYQQYLTNLDVQRNFELAAFPKSLSAAWGLEFRDERFAIRAGEPASYEEGAVLLPNGQPAPGGAQVFGGFRPQNVTDRSRHSVSAYLDLEQDLTQRWNLALAGRTERYSDFGSTMTYKVATRLRLAEGLALRGGVATGFRAPSLHQQFFSTSSINNLGGRFVEVGTFSVTDGVARALGARDLRPETSRNLAAGIVFDGVDRLSVTLDWFRILIDNRIVLTENLGASGTPEQNAAVQALLSAAGYGSISGARFFINGLDTRTQGVDIVGSYHISGTHVGDWQLSAGFNYTRTDITRFSDDPGPLAQIPGLVLFGRLESERIERGQPRSKLNLAVEWQKNVFGATVRTNRYGEVFAASADSRDNLAIQPVWVTDVELRYSPAHWQLALGADNVLDKYPTHEPTGPRPASVGGYYAVNNYFLPFSGFSPSGFSGRYLYGRVSYRY